MKQNPSSNREHAIVLGASMAGLLAARVLSDHYCKVTLIERDTLPPRIEQRRGVPQGRHTHGLLASGREVLEQFFPGISRQLVAGGAVAGDIVRDARWFMEGGCLSRPTSALNGLLMTRPFLEGNVRQRVLALSNVTVRHGTAIDGLCASADSRRITGIRIRGETLRADLTVDAMGRGSRTPQWLQSIGYDKPPEEMVQIALGYTTRFFRRRPADLAGDIGVIVAPTPDGKRGGVMIAQEGDRWTVTLIAHFGHYAPEDLAGFIGFARILPASDIYEVIRDAEPLGPPASARFPASIRRRYESLRRFPAGYLVFGDAISSFNPIYGQGMSVAALQAVQLDKTLADDTDDLARRFFARAAKVVDIPWSIAAGNDLRMPQAVGRRSCAVKFINWYMSRLHKAAHFDPELSVAFHRVANLLAPPRSVLFPRIVGRVIWQNIRPVWNWAQTRSREAAPASN
jgi:2-polyprenyl-6-methoxyphenol hydroxylase-like FAD-dependent oxidoreductase